MKTHEVTKEELKAEIVYWKETAEHYKKEFEKLKQKC